MIKVVIHDNIPTTAYEELGLPQASPQSSWSLDAATMTRYLKTSWDTSGDLIRQLLGYIGSSDSSGTSFHFYLPHKYGGADFSADLRCQTVSTAPFGQSEALASSGEFAKYTQWPEAIFTATYETVPNTVNALYMLFDEDYQASVEFITTPGRKLFWNADGKTEPVGEDESLGVLFPRGDWTYTIKRIPYLRDAFWDHQGGVNSTAMYSPKYNFTFSAGTILYENMVATEHINHMGDLEFRAELKFVYNSLGWNKFPRAGHQKADGTPELLPMYDDTPKQYKPYKEVELNDLLLTT